MGGRFVSLEPDCGCLAGGVWKSAPFWRRELLDDLWVTTVRVVFIASLRQLGVRLCRQGT